MWPGLTLTIPAPVQRIVFAQLIASGLAATTSAVGQSIYQPGFREILQAPSFSARSVELNRNVWAWDSAEHARPGADDVFVRISEYGIRTGIVTDAAGNTVLSNYDTRHPQHATSAQVYLGTRVIDRGNRLQLAADQQPWSGDQQWDQTLNSTMLGPQVGSTNLVSIGNWQLSTTLAGVLAYHHGHINQFATLRENALPYHSLYPTRASATTIDLSQSAQLLSYSAEIEVAVSYRFSEQTQLSLAWTNIYLSNVWESSGNSTIIRQHGYAVPSHSRNADDDLWLDSLHLSLVLTR